MDAVRERIEADLKGLLSGEIRCDDVFLQLYASDASIFEIRPLGVIRPRGTADVVAAVRYAHENGIPVHARGAGTGLAGEALGPGLVIDFSHSMRRIVACGEDTVRVQPGVVHAQLNGYLAPRGRLFGPDPATSTVTTMGSVLAIDASGSHWLRYGSARRHVVSMQVVLHDGEVLEVGRERIPSSTEAAGSTRRRELVGQLAELLEREAKVIDAYRGRSLVNRSGYQLTDVLADDHLDMARLLVGSEGTLALITEATVQTQVLAPVCGVALLFCDRLEAAARAALEIPQLGASACDLMDRRLLSIARETDSVYAQLIPQAAEAMLLVEFQGREQAQVRDSLTRLVSLIQRRKRLAFDARTALDPEDVELYWRLPNRVVPRLYRLRGSTRPLPFVEDVAVPPPVLPDFLVRLQNVLKKWQVTASLFAHAGHGQLHIRPFLDLADPEQVRRLQDLAAELYDEVLAVRGTISGEHADGLSRSPFVRKQFGPVYDVFREVKRIFDPHNILNPGKIVGDDPDLGAKNLRPVPKFAAQPSTNGAPLGTAEAMPPTVEAAPAVPLAAETIALQLNWNAEQFSLAARSCNGCGHCRTQTADSRMCPIFRFAPAEEASPRAKANLVRAVLTGRLPPQELTSEAFKEFADLCVHCHQCRLECPASVDIPRLMAECKAQYVATNGLRPTDWFFSRLEQFSAWGSLMSPVANWALANRQMRWVLEKLFGIAHGRKLPRLAQRSFLRRANRRRLTRPTRRSGRKVVYFVDLYANWYDVQLADALVAILEHNGVAVYVHPAQHPAGMGLISMGAVDRVKRLAAKNVTLLAEAVRQGYHIVATEPAAALCLTHEYPRLIDDDDARLVAENTSEACTYLWKMHQSGKLELDLRPINVAFGYHLPCHLKALGVGTPGLNLLRLVPGLVVEQIERGCSGMAGFYGLKQENYRGSLRAGWGLISALREPGIHFGATECSSCKMQMEQGTTKPTIHPLKVLALAYGLMPELAGLLSAHSEELVVT